MLSADRIMGVKEAAELLGVSSQAFANLRNRYKEDFPVPCVELTATPIFDRLDIERWAEAHNRTYKSENSIANLGTYKTIAFCGRPRVGKSFLVSLFLDEPFAYRAGCSQHGDDFTQCAVQHYVSSEIKEPCAIFHNKRKDDHGADADGMDGIQCPVRDEKFPQFMREITDYLKSKREAGEEISSDVYIEIYMCPSSMAREIMAKCNVKTLIITDTPGVSSDYSLVPIEKADLVVLVATDSNRTEAKESYGELVEKLAPLIASSKMCFMYRISSPCDDEEEYQEIQEEAKDAMLSFEDFFSGLRTSIIESSMEVLQPAKTVIGIPPMKAKKKSAAEGLFVNHITEKIVELLTKENVAFEEVANEITNAGVSKDELLSFVKSLLAAWSFESLEKDVQQEYTLNTFKNERHDRVMSADNYRLLYAVNMARRKQLQSLYLEFKKYNEQNCPEMWKQMLVKYVYSRLSTAVKDDMGVSKGTHHFESQPPVTMYAMESILARDVWDSVIVSDADTYQKVQKYISVLRNYEVTSNSWGYVNLDLQNVVAKTKLYLIDKCKLNEIKVENTTDMVWSRYTLGLQKVAEFLIWEDMLNVMGVSKDDITKEIEVIMFEG